MGIDNIKKGYPHIDPYSKGMDIHGPTYEDKLRDQVHQSEMASFIQIKFLEQKTKAY